MLTSRGTAFLPATVRTVIANALPLVSSRTAAARVAASSLRSPALVAALWAARPGWVLVSCRHMATAATGDLQDQASSLYDDEAFDEIAPVPQTGNIPIHEAGLTPYAVKLLQHAGIEALFPAQAETLPIIISGRDVVCKSPTGSGKTLAFAVPIALSLLGEHGRPPRATPARPTAIILTPTRELARQVAREFERVAPTLRVLTCYGGAAISPQERSLRGGVHIVVGTPGRVMDLQRRGELHLGSVSHVVLDEADAMLGRGFREDVELILQDAPKERQTLLWSATVPEWVQDLARRFCRTPEWVDLVRSDAEFRVPESVSHLAVPAPKDRTQLLRLLQRAVAQLCSPSERAIVFTRTKAEAEEVGRVLGDMERSRRVDVRSLHGDVSQRLREDTLQRFREGRVQRLVATDVAARGIDVPEVKLVVHLGLPQDLESFVHRSGRTGRAGAAGTNLVLYRTSEGEHRRLREFKEALDIELVYPSMRGARSAAEMAGGAPARAARDARDLLAAAFAERLALGMPAAAAAAATAAEKGSGSGDTSAATGAGEARHQHDLPAPSPPFAQSAARVVGAFGGDPHRALAAALFVLSKHASTGGSGSSSSSSSISFAEGDHTDGSLVLSLLTAEPAHATVMVPGQFPRGARANEMAQEVLRRIGVPASPRAVAWQPEGVLLDLPLAIVQRLIARTNPEHPRDMLGGGDVPHPHGHKHAVGGLPHVRVVDEVPPGLDLVSQVHVVRDGMGGGGGSGGGGGGAGRWRSSSGSEGSWGGRGAPRGGYGSTPRSFDSRPSPPRAAPGAFGAGRWGAGGRDGGGRGGGDNDDGFGRVVVSSSDRQGGYASGGSRRFGGASSFDTRTLDWGSEEVPTFRRKGNRS